MQVQIVILASVVIGTPLFDSIAVPPPMNLFALAGGVLIAKAISETIKCVPSNIF